MILKKQDKPNVLYISKHNDSQLIIKYDKFNHLNMRHKFTFIYNKFTWLHRSYLISKIPLKSNLYYFLMEWEVYATREWEKDFSFYEAYHKLYEWDDEGFFVIRGFLFNWIDYSDKFYDKYNNILNKNRILQLYPKTTILVKSKFIPLKKKIYKNYLRISYSFGRYVRFYKSFIKIEYLLYIDNQHRIGPKDVKLKFDPLFSTFKFTKQLFIYFLKYNKLYLYKNIQYELYKSFNTKYRNVFIINSPYLWVSTTEYNVDVMTGDNENINFDQPYTNNLFNLYYIYSNNKSNDRFKTITNLDDFKFVDWEYYTDGSGIFEFEFSCIDSLVNTYTLVNKFYLIEIYKILILLYVKKI